MKWKRVLIGTGVSLLTIVLADQIAVHTLLRGDRLLGRRIAPFDPPIFNAQQEQYLERIGRHLRTGDPPRADFHFDADLGWTNLPGTGGGEFRYDWAGCRIATAPLAREKRPGVRRVLALGCSFTHGDESRARETWIAHLERLRPDLEIANLGVSAYGLDQALLRLRRDGRLLEGDEVWLGFLPSAALRVTTLDRSLLNHWSPGIGFKPRFLLAEDGELELRPSPARDLEQVWELLHSQADFLAALGDGDTWVNRAPLAYAERGSCLLHSSLVGRLALTLHERAGRDPRRALSDPEGEVLRLVRAIVEETAREARSQTARFRLLILPGADDLATLAAGEPCWGALERNLQAEGTEVLDVGDALLAARNAGGDLLFAAHGHYSERGHRVVAEALAGLLAE